MLALVITINVVAIAGLINAIVMYRHLRWHQSELEKLEYIVKEHIWNEHVMGERQP